MTALEEMGLALTATADEVNKRFKELSKIHHPDKGGDTHAFTQLVKLRTDALREVATRKCAECGGDGVVQETHGFFTHNVKCPRCKGSGR